MIKSESDEKIYLVLDIGTSDIKCGCVDSKFNITAQFKREFPMEQKGRFFEINFDLFFNIANDLLMECLADPVVDCSMVGALLITSQAQTFAPVDADFSPIDKGIVWMDGRAKKESAFLKERLPDFGQTAGFKRPLPNLYVSKLLWLKQNKPTLFEKARAFPLINEYLVYCLTGQFYSDSTGFGMGGLYDIRRNLINREILQILDLTKDYFPRVENAVEKGALISLEIQQEWDLNYRFPVFLCGNDQGASACGAGLQEPGDVNINFGTAMVFYTLTDSVADDLTEDQIAGKHPVGDHYFLLNFESDFGLQIRRLKESFFKNSSYDRFFQTYNQYDDVDERMPVLEQNDLHFDSEADSHRFCAGVIKYYLGRFRFHLAQIRNSVSLKNITLSGGLVVSEVWLEILRSNIDQPFTINNRANAGMLGALYIYFQNRNRKSYE